MRSLTKVQIATIAIIIIYIIWEIFVQVWAKRTDADNVIRVDLVILYPIIIILVIISLYQYFKH